MHSPWEITMNLVLNRFSSLSDKNVEIFFRSIGYVDYWSTGQVVSRFAHKVLWR
jgi:hypothetical protein